MTQDSSELVGIGLYTVREAALLTDTSTRSVRRWVSGYIYRRGDVVRKVEPVWTPQILAIDDTVALGFLDLMELRFVTAFRRYGVSWKIIRAAAARAREMFERDHPFSAERFRTDGRRIFAEILEDSRDERLFDLVRDQYAFHNVVTPSLYASLEFSEHDEVLRWFPLYPRQTVVVDPARAFGRPISAAEGVPTELLARAVEMEGSESAVSKWFDVSPASVRAAVAFESRLAA